MHISQNYFCQASSMTCPWDMTCSTTHCSIKLNLSRTMQIMTNSIILHYALHANLPNSRESGGFAVLLKGTLSDWMMVKERSLSPSPPNPSCGHLCPTTVQPFFCYRISRIELIENLNSAWLFQHIIKYYQWWSWGLGVKGYFIFRTVFLNTHQVFLLTSPKLSACHIGNAVSLRS